MKSIKTISIKCETKDTMKLEDMTVLQGNLKARTEEDYAKIKKSILKYGFSFPAFIWVEKKTKTNFLIDGTGRYSALKQMQEEGYLIPELPIVYIQAKDRAEAKNKLLRLNSQYGKMSKDSVLEFASDIELDFSEIALPDTTISFEDEQETQETEGDDDIPDIDEKEKPNSERGCMYELGNSILMCGDSTNAEDVARLMGGEKADMVFTDPPYNVAYTGGMQIKDGHIESNGKKQIKNDEMDYNSFYQFLLDAFSNIKEFTNNKSGLYIFHSTNQARAFINAFYDAGLKQRAIIAWHKTGGGFGDFMAQYMNAYEPCIYGSNGETVNWYGPTDEKTLWDMDKEKKCDLHPTMKPVALVERAIKNSSRGGQLVLDLFGGSGSTLIACEKNNRKARLMELDPKYCDVIRKRYTKWAKENGKPITSGCLE